MSGPLLAFVGAALYTGSVLHPHNASVSRTGSEYRRWLLLTGVRIAYLGLIAVVTGSTAVAVIAVLSALGPPAFNPPQQAVLYGYRSGSGDGRGPVGLALPARSGWAWPW